MVHALFMCDPHVTRRTWARQNERHGMGFPQAYLEISSWPSTPLENRSPAVWALFKLFGSLAVHENPRSFPFGVARKGFMVYTKTETKRIIFVNCEECIYFIRNIMQKRITCSAAQPASVLCSAKGAWMHILTRWVAFQSFDGPCSVSSSCAVSQLRSNEELQRQNERHHLHGKPSLLGQKNPVRGERFRLGCLSRIKHGAPVRGTATYPRGRQRRCWNAKSRSIFSSFFQLATVKMLWSDGNEM